MTYNVLTFGDIEIEKNESYHNKNPILQENKHKYFIFYLYNDCLLEKYDTICDKVNAVVKKKFIASLPTMKNL